MFIPLVVAKFRERLPVIKRTTQKFDMQGFNLKKLNDVEVRELYRVKILNKYAALENARASGDFNNLKNVCLVIDKILA